MRTSVVARHCLSFGALRMLEGMRPIQAFLIIRQRQKVSFQAQVLFAGYR
jgi:hypothetical protein